MVERVFVEITDIAGRVSPEFVRVETLAGGAVRFVREDGSYWTFPDGLGAREEAA